MKGIKEHKKTVILLVSLLIIVITLVVAFGRYVYNSVRNYYLETKGFYFNSETMSQNGSSHTIHNWDGVNAYVINIDVNNKKNDYIKTGVDIEYDIEVECSSNVRCELSKNSGIIYKDGDIDTYSITVLPIGTLSSYEEAVIKTKATSKSPYVKTLSTTYNIGIETYSFTYKIIDSVGSKYLELEFTNSFSYYKVEEPFGTYNVGDNISLDEYVRLSDTDKDKCMSAKIDLSIDNSKVRLDMTDETYLEDAKDIIYENISGSNYVKGFKFKVDANSSTRIIFYKLNVSEDYSNDNNLFDLNIDTVE